MLTRHAFIFAGSIAIVALANLTPTQAHECHCTGMVLNGLLNTADFTGGVGYGAEYGDSYGGGYAMSVPYTSAFAFAHAHAFAFARSSAHGGHFGGGHGCHGGGGHR